MKNILCVYVYVCVCVYLSTVNASSAWIKNAKELINDVMLKKFLFYAKSFHR